MTTIEMTGVDPGRVVAALARRRLAAALGRLTVTPVRARIVFFDDDGPKGGPAVRCALTIRLPYRPLVRVEEAAGAPRQAFDGAFASLERQLERYRERQRESRRRPKKYYAARRLTS